MKAIAFILAAMSVWFGGAAQARQETTRAREAMSARAASKQAQQDLLSIMKPDGRFKRGMFVTLHGAGFTTPSYGTEIPGVCAHDSMWLEYAPVSKEAHDPRDNPVQPFALHLSHLFSFTRIPTVESIAKFEDGQPSANPFRRECAHLSTDSDSIHWFGADDAETAVRGFLALQAVARRVQAGTLQPTNCELYSANEKQGCSAMLATLSKLESIDSVEHCQSASENQCFIVNAGSNKITITAKSGNVVRPDDVLSFTMEEYIIVT